VQETDQISILSSYLSTTDYIVGRTYDQKSKDVGSNLTEVAKAEKMHLSLTCVIDLKIGDSQG
jgi:hypothetical protein